VESCLVQSYSNWELVIVDDCSTDDTPELIAEYVGRDSRIASVRRQENGKLPAALNTGFALARGDLLTWTSDDNIYRPEAIEVLVDHLSAAKGVDLVYSDWSYIDDAGRLVEARVAYEPDFLPYCNCVMYCFLYTRAIQEKIGGYDETLFLVEDYDFWLRASRFFKFKRVHRDLAMARRHETCLSTVHATAVRQATMRLLERGLAEAGWTGRSKSLAHLRLAGDAAFLGERHSAWVHLIEAFKTCPRSILTGQALPALVRLITGEAGLHALRRIYRKAAAGGL
jgi:glycosyltransferase involved in cell wall biosynthesis